MTEAICLQWAMSLVCINIIVVIIMSGRREDSRERGTNVDNLTPDNTIILLMAIWQYYIRTDHTRRNNEAFNIWPCYMFNLKSQQTLVWYLAFGSILTNFYLFWTLRYDLYEVRETTWRRGEQLKYNRRHFPSQEDLNFSEIQNKFNYQIPTMTKSFSMIHKL